jgi:RNA polymerase sigma-70 factor, ECF subfamily
MVVRGDPERVERDNVRPDDDLAGAAARGDRDALETLMHRHFGFVHGICRRILNDPEDALDATQEAMLAIARGITSFDGRARFTTWCYRVATNAALDEARRRHRRPRPVAELPERTAVGSSTQEDTADRLDVEAALGTLSPEFRAAVALRDLAGLDYAEIAEILEIPPGTVRSRIARGRAALADQLTDRRTRNQTDAPEHPTPQQP